MMIYIHLIQSYDYYMSIPNFVQNRRSYFNSLQTICLEEDEIID